MVPIPSRKRLFLGFLTPLFATGLVLTAATAQKPETGLAPRSPQGPLVRPGLLEVPPETLAPRLLEIREYLEGRSETLKALNARYRAAGSDAEAMRVQREIHDLKRGTEVGLLEIQLRYAREENNEEAVAFLEATLEEVKAGPVTRPAPNRPHPETNR